MADPATDTFQHEARGGRRRPPLAVNLATAILVILVSVTLVFLVPALIIDLTSDRPATRVGIGDLLLATAQVAVAAAVLVLSVLVRRGRRWAWLTLVGLLVLDAVTGPIRIAASRANDLSADLPFQLASAAVTLIFAVLLVAPRSSRAYFRASG